MIKTITHNISGNDYQITQFPAMRGLRLAVKLAKITAPSIGKALGGGSVGGIMDKEIDLGDALGALVDRLDQQDTVAFIIELLGMTHRNGRDLSSEVNFNEAYSGNYGELFFALKKVLEVNYGSFWGAITTGGLTGGVADSKKAEQVRCG